MHPESPPEVIALADAVGPTSQIHGAAKSLPHALFIVATEARIFHKMKQAAPDKEFIAATMGDGATCVSCADRPWIKMNDLSRLLHVLDTRANEITIPEVVRARAEVSIRHTVEFASAA